MRVEAQYTDGARVCVKLCLKSEGLCHYSFPTVPSTPFAKLQTLVYDILSPATAIIGYATGFRKPSANSRFFVGAQNNRKFGTDNSDYIDRHFFYNRPHCLRHNK